MGKISGHDNYIASNDSDIFIFGNPQLVLDLNSKDKEFYSIS